MSESLYWIICWKEQMDRFERKKNNSPRFPLSWPEIAARPAHFSKNHPLPESAHKMFNHFIFPSLSSPPIISTHWPPHPRLIITTHGEKTVPETREVIGRWMSLRISILESRIYFALECIRLDPKNTTCVACP